MTVLIKLVCFKIFLAKSIAAPSFLKMLLVCKISKLGTHGYK